VIDNPFLHDLTPEQYDLLAPLFTEIELPAGTALCRQGEPAMHLYLLTQGQVTLRYKPYDGPRITLSRLGPGDVLGWSAVIGNEVYTSDAICNTSVEALKVRGDRLRTLCAEYPTAGKAILERLANVVSPRWIGAQEQIQRVLQMQMLSKCADSGGVTERRYTRP
jgi:CRP/FNR family cyclic AMP-dependent transcriptional regulator